MLLCVAHTNAIAVYINFSQNGTVNMKENIRFRHAAKVNGNKQYPNKQML
jgi:hypothetical protein